MMDFVVWMATPKFWSGRRAEFDLQSENRAVSILVLVTFFRAPAPVASRQLGGPLLPREGITVPRAAEIVRVQAQGKMAPKPLLLSFWLIFLVFDFFRALNQSFSDLLVHFHRTPPPLLHAALLRLLGRHCRGNIKFPGLGGKKPPF